MKTFLELHDIHIDLMPVRLERIGKMVRLLKGDYILGEMMIEDDKIAVCTFIRLESRSPDLHRCLTGESLILPISCEKDDSDEAIEDFEQNRKRKQEMETKLTKYIFPNID